MNSPTIEIERFSENYIRVVLIDSKTGDKSEPIVIFPEDVEMIVESRKKPSRIILPGDNTDDGR